MIRFDSIWHDNGGIKSSEVVGVSEECILSTTNFVSDGNIIKDDFLVSRSDSSGEMTFNVLSIVSEFLYPVEESEFNCFEGGIPCTGPFATRLDLLGWFSVEVCLVPLMTPSLFRVLTFIFYFLFFYLSFYSTRISLLKVKRTKDEVC